MAKPFKDPIDDEANLAEGTKRLMDKFEENLDGAPVEVPVEDPVEDDPDEELDETEPSRRDKRAARGANYRTMRERNAANEARAQLLQEENDRLRATPPQIQQPTQQQVAPTAHLEEQRDSIYKQQQSLFAEYNNKVAYYQRAKQQMPEAEYKDYEKRAATLDEQKTLILVDIREARTAPQRQMEQQQQLYRARAPDVFHNPRASQWAGAYFSQKKAENPNIDSEALFEEAVEGARRAVLGKRPPPDQATRQRATGASRGAMASSSSSAPRVQMTPGMVKMAKAAYPKLSEKEAAQKWANKNGKQFLEMERDAGR